MALATVALANVFSIIAERHRAALADVAALAPRAADLSAMHRADDAVSTTAAVALIAILATGVLFITWLFRAVKTVKAMDPLSVRYKPGWAIGGWFVPILNLVRPKQMVDDVWTGSSPGLPRDSSPIVVHLWWAAFLIAGFMDRISTQSDSTTLRSLADSDRLKSWSDGLDIIAAALAITVVVKISRRIQRAKSQPFRIRPSARPW